MDDQAMPATDGCNGAANPSRRRHNLIGLVRMSFSTLIIRVLINAAQSARVFGLHVVRQLGELSDRLNPQPVQFVLGDRADPPQPSNRQPSQ